MSCDVPGYGLSNWHTDYKLILLSAPLAGLFAPFINKETEVREFYFIFSIPWLLRRGVKAGAALKKNKKKKTKQKQRNKNQTIRCPA